MKKAITFISIILLFIPSGFSQNNYDVKYEKYDEGYSTQHRFLINEVTSDYGGRQYNGWDWHKGVDYDNPEGNTQIEDQILSIVNQGVVTAVFGEGYRRVYIKGMGTEPNLGYGHLFQHGPITSAGIRNGDMVIKRMDIPAYHYAIIDLTSGIAIGPTSSGTVSYEGEVYSVTNYVYQDDPIGIIGNSGRPGTNYAAHLHLYLFNNITNGTAESNCYDPFSVINYKNNPSDPFFTRYNVRIMSVDENQNNAVLTRILPQGNDNSSVVVRVIMSQESYGTPSNHYDNDVMDICNVKLFIRPFYCEVEDDENHCTKTNC